MGSWAVGADAVPDEWAGLTKLRRLELRGHTSLAALPDWLPALGLTHLDVAGCTACDVRVVARCTTLHTLSLQSLKLHDALVEGQAGGVGAAGGGAAGGGAAGGGAAPVPQAGPAPLPAPEPAAAGPPAAAAVPEVAPTRRLPDLGALTQLTGLNLSDNCLRSVPPMLSRLARLRHLDLSGNGALQVAAPLAVLASLPALAVVDLRGVHADAGLGYWSEAKCVTMRHISALARTAKRRARAVRVLVELD